MVNAEVWGDSDRVSGTAGVGIYNPPPAGAVHDGGKRSSPRGQERRVPCAFPPTRLACWPMVVSPSVGARTHKPHLGGALR